MAEDFIFEETVKIYDTDAQAIVHYAGYYRFFTDALEAFAYERIGMMFPRANENVWFVVVESNAKYHKSARVGDKLTVHLTSNIVSDKAIRFDFKIMRGSDFICEGFITQVTIDKNTWKAVPIPKEIADKLI